MTVLTEDQRHEIRKNFHKSLEDHLSSDAKAVGFIFISTFAGNTPMVSSGLLGHASAPEIMAGLIMELVSFGTALGISPIVTMEGINFARKQSSPDQDVDADAATEMRQ